MLSFKNPNNRTLRILTAIILTIIVLFCSSCALAQDQSSDNHEAIDSGTTQIDTLHEQTTPSDTSTYIDQTESEPVPESDDPVPESTDFVSETDDVSDTVPVTETEPVTEPVPDDSYFEIYYIDVGQGDAACVVCDDRVMLIDGGSSANSSLIFSFLRNHGFSHLDIVVATHADADHVGGLAGALNYAFADLALSIVTEHESESFNNFLKYLGKQDVSITVPVPGDEYQLGSAKVTIIYPGIGVRNSDNTSICLRVEYGETSFLFTGDNEIEDEDSILRSGYDINSDVIKIAHHGSKYSSQSRLLSAVSPKYAIISVGGSNT